MFFLEGFQRLKDLIDYIYHRYPSKVLVQVTEPLLLGLKAGGPGWNRSPVGGPPSPPPSSGQWRHKAPESGKVDPEKWTENRLKVNLI